MCEKLIPQTSMELSAAVLQIAPFGFYTEPDSSG